MSRSIFTALVAALAAAVPLRLEASAPPFIPLQGFLEDASGEPVSGDLSVHFSIYDAQVEGSVLWYETQNVLVEEGLFAVYLGEVEAIDLGMFRDSTNLWLGVQVESDPEMERVYLGSTPFTGYAEYCGNIPDHGHDYSQISGTEAVVAGAQSCAGGDKVVGVDITGALVCAADDDTTYLAGSGLFLSGNTFSVDTGVVQARVTGSCAGGSSIRVILDDGTVVCEPDDDTVYTDAAAVAAVQAADQYVLSSGDSMSGDLTISGALTVTGGISGSLSSGVGPAGGRICPVDHYLSMGYCLPKGAYADRSSCPSGGTLQNGVCYSWPSPQCQWLTLSSAMSACAAEGGRLCTVAELDRLDGTGCGQDSTVAWANLAAAYNTSAAFGLCIRNQGGLVSSAGGTPHQSDDVDDDIAWCFPVQHASPTAQSPYTGYVICCYD
jgi:hypothetical protein